MAQLIHHGDNDLKQELLTYYTYTLYESHEGDPVLCTSAYQFPEMENVKLVEEEKGQHFLRLHQGEPKTPPSSCREPKTCNNVDCQGDIFFMEIKNLQIIQEEKSTKSPVDLWRVHKQTKKPVWLTNLCNPC